MSRLILISGENNSGKSAFAERLIAHTSDERYYIATMIAQTEDNHLQIKKHRQQRAGLGFNTLELSYKVGNAPITRDCIVLLEDVSNLLANNIFEKGNCTDAVFKDISELLNRCKILVAVTIAGLRSDGYDDETAKFIDSLNELNKKLFDRADIAIMMVDNTPVYQKGEAYDFS